MQAKQLPLLRAARLPFVVRRRAVGRAVGRVMSAYMTSRPAADRPAAGFCMRALAEDEALLAELRNRSRAASGKGCVRAAAFAASPEGRRVHRMIDELSARIEAQEVSLCG